MFKKFHWKITIIYFSLFLVTFVLAGELLYPVLLHYFEKNEEKHLSLESQLVLTAIKPYLANNRLEEIDSLIKQMGKDLAVRITVIGDKGQVLADSQKDPKQMSSHFDRPEVIDALRGHKSAAIRYSNSMGYSMLYVAVPIALDQNKTEILRLSVPMADIRKSVVQVQQILFAVTGVALIISTILAFYLARRFTAPIRSITEVAQKLALGNFQTMVEVRTGDELGNLGTTVNNMAVHLQRMIRDLSNEKNKVMAILTGMGDGVVALDEKGRIALVNQSAERLFHRKEEEVSGKYIHSLVRNFKVEEVVKQVMMTRKLVVDEIKTSTAPDTNIRIHGAPIKADDGDVVGVVLVFRDITDIRQLEQIRTDFVANVSHELKTPLTSIKGFVETLLDGALEDSDNCRHFLEIISEETDRLHRLIANLLSLAGIEAPKFEPIFQVTDLGAVVRKTAAVFGQQAESKGIKIDLEIEPGLPKVIIKEGLLAQVILNLVENAVKYTLAGGSVQVAAKSENNLVRVQVMDSGIGIPEECLSRIFERFYRVDKARSRDIGGTGLGLSIVKHILERYDQKIYVESVLGQGTCFTFTLATAPSAAK